MMRKIILSFLCILLQVHMISCFFLVYADDTLELDTEKLKNKQDTDYSSLTDINGMNIFTDDMKKIMKNKEIENQKNDNQIHSQLFTNQIKSIDQNKEKEQLFQTTVTFNKTDNGNYKDLSIEPIVFIATPIAVFIVFVLTKKHYQERRKLDNENNTHIIQ